MARSSFALYDESNPTERRLFNALAEVCFKNSLYDFTAGGRGANFFDVDGFALHAKKVDEATGQAVVEPTWIAERVAQAIEQQKESGRAIERVAFMERDTGPVGMILYNELIASRTGIETCFIRPRKRLLLSAFKGRPLSTGEQVALISDVATSGDTILAAAEKIWQLGAIVSCAIVLYDRLEGAREYLSLYDIDLVSIFDEANFREAGLIKEAPEQREPIVQVLGAGTTG